jgi:hypothetical protein
MGSVASSSMMMNENFSEIFLKRLIENWDTIAIRIEQDCYLKSHYLSQIEDKRQILDWIRSKLRLNCVCGSKKKPRYSVLDEGVVCGESDCRRMIISDSTCLELSRLMDLKVIPEDFLDIWYPITLVSV